MKVKALVVDDSKVMRMMVKNNLDATDLAEFDFIEAEDGADGLKKFKSAKPDMMFVDWNMPKMSGVDLVREVRKKDMKIPIVMVTSEKVMSKVMEAIEQAGADNYICKPFTLEDFELKVSKLLSRIA